MLRLPKVKSAMCILQKYGFRFNVKEREWPVSFMNKLIRL